jgi:hypothetical protein
LGICEDRNFGGRDETTGNTELIIEEIPCVLVVVKKVQINNSLP